MNVERACVTPARSPLPYQMPGAGRWRLTPPAIAVGFRNGEQIYDQDDKADRVYRVIRGTVRASRLLADGRRQVGGFYFEGDLFGVEAGDIRRYTAEALGAGCKVAAVWPCPSTAIDADALERLISEATRQELGRAQDHTALLARTSACEKVATFLLILANRFGPERIRLPMGRQDMADYLGITIETISRTLGRLQAEDIVEFRGCREFLVKRPGALERLALS